MRPTPCGCTSARLSGFTGLPRLQLLQLCLRRPTFSVAPEKVGKKKRFVLASSISLVPPQAAGLVHFAARPLRIANASLVCNLVPSVLPEKVGLRSNSCGVTANSAPPVNPDKIITTTGINQFLCHSHSSNHFILQLYQKLHTFFRISARSVRQADRPQRAVQARSLHVGFQGSPVRSCALRRQWSPLPAGIKA